MITNSRRFCGVLGGRIGILPVVLMVQFFCGVVYADDVCGVGYDVYCENCTTSILSAQAGVCDNTALFSAPGVYLVLDEKCESGEYPTVSGCVQPQAGGCVAGYFLSGGSTVNVLSTTGGVCNGIGLFSAPGVYLMTDEKCGAGYFPATSGCAQFGTNESCPDGYYTPRDYFTRADADNVCDSDQISYPNEVSICSNHVVTTEALCTPQLRCQSGETLRTSNGVIVPLWSDVLTTPSLNFGFSDGEICYMNMVSGSENGTINILENNNIYHGVK